MPNTKDINFSNHVLKVLIYGPSGTGKTYASRTLPKPIYLFDLELGTICLAGEDITYDTYVDLDPNKPTAWLRFKKKLEQEVAHPQYASYVIDPLTGVQRILMNHILALNQNVDGLMAIGHWGMFAGHMSSLVWKFPVLGKHLVVTAHEKEKTEPIQMKGQPKKGVGLKPGEPPIKPSVYTKALPDELTNRFNEMYHAEVSRMGGYEWRTEPTSLYVAKSRLAATHPWLKGMIEQDFTALLEGLKKEGKNVSKV